MEEIDISKFLIFDGTEIKGGHTDALIIYATKVHKTSEGIACCLKLPKVYLKILFPAEFGEAFLSTFRTFIEPFDLVEKLTYRYTYFNQHFSNDQKQKVAKESFSLLVRVVNDLT
jgi:Rap guanine nucleotide exchange factor 1